jgi:hypothetical protein
MSGRLSYDDDITIAQAAQIITYLYTGAALSSPVGPPPVEGSGTGDLASERRRLGLTPRDALVSADAQTNPEKIVAFALYVERQGSKDTFTLEDIKPLFRQARESVPGNLSRDLDSAIRSGWVAAASEKGEYYVTDVAVDVLGSGVRAVARLSRRLRVDCARRRSQRRRRLRISRSRPLSRVTSTTTRSRPRQISTFGQSMLRNCGVSIRCRTPRSSGLPTNWVWSCRPVT